MPRLPFIKMQGLGNDYVYLDLFQPETARTLQGLDLPALARRLSERHFGIGADGLVLMMPSEQADVRMRMFNADGSEAQMCGNAARCVGRYMYESGRCHRDRMRLETPAGIRLVAPVVENGELQRVTVNMGVPVAAEDRLLIGQRLIPFVRVDMGNPHAVLFTDQPLEQLDISALGPQIAHHPLFAEGTNVEWVRVLGPHELALRVWERGSGETLACGTGACAAVVAAYMRHLTEKDVIVHLAGGDLQICWQSDAAEILMTGPAEIAFHGEFYL